MKFIDLTCPSCGAQLKIKPGARQAVCEYCGHSLIIKEDPLRPNESPKTETEKYREKLERERYERKASMQHDADVARGKAIMAIYGAVAEAKRRVAIELARIFICILAAAAAYGAVFLAVKSGAVPVEYAGYIPYLWIPMLPLGFFIIIKSRGISRSIVFGLGIGLLIFWLRTAS